MEIKGGELRLLGRAFFCPQVKTFKAKMLLQNDLSYLPSWVRLGGRSWSSENVCALGFFLRAAICTLPPPTPHTTPGDFRVYPGLTWSRLSGPVVSQLPLSHHEPSRSMEKISGASPELRSQGNRCRQPLGSFFPSSMVVSELLQRGGHTLPEAPHSRLQVKSKCTQEGWHPNTCG